jgi:hypothetical protein
MTPTNKEKKLLADKIRRDLEAYLAKGRTIASYGTGVSGITTALPSYKGQPANWRTQNEADAFNKRRVDRNTVIAPR